MALFILPQIAAAAPQSLRETLLRSALLGGKAGVWEQESDVAKDCAP